VRRVAVPGLIERIGCNDLDVMSIPLSMADYARSWGAGGTYDWGALHTHKYLEAIGSCSPQIGSQKTSIGCCRELCCRMKVVNG
jgi:hypothetical protein